MEGLPATHPAVESLPVDSVSPALMLQGMALSCMIWPSKESLGQRVERRRKEVRQDTEVMSRIVWHFIREGDSIIAMARTFRRVVAEASGRRFPVLALAGVCTHPEHRGRGLGRAVVMAAWSRVDPELPVCFFQTGVPAFYERMGARTIPNRIYNSMGTRRAFWDPHAMIYPAAATWPEEAIDLLGLGW